MKRQENGTRNRVAKCSIGSEHFTQPCCAKMLFLDLTDAESALLQYMARITFSTMTVYRCVTHQGFHLGHDRFMEPTEVVSRYQRQASSLCSPSAILDPIALTNYTGKAVNQYSVVRPCRNSGH